MVDLEDFGLESWVRLKMSFDMEFEARDDSGLDIVGDAELPGLVNDESESAPAIEEANHVVLSSSTIFSYLSLLITIPKINVC